MSGSDQAYDDKRGLRGIIFDQALGELPTRDVISVDPGATVAEAIRAMNEAHVGCVLVMREGEIVGIFTERDVLTRVAGQGVDLDATPVEQVMTGEPDTLPEEASVAFALHRMSVKGYRHIPLVDQGRPVGVVSVRGIVDWMVDLLPDSVLNLPPEPGYPSSVDGG